MNSLQLPEQQPHGDGAGAFIVTDPSGVANSNVSPGPFVTTLYPSHIRSPTLQKRPSQPGQREAFSSPAQAPTSSIENPSHESLPTNLSLLKLLHNLPCHPHCLKLENRTSLVVQWLRVQGHQFNSWSRKISHAMGPLSPCATSAESEL